jgi:hypothetical protein
MAGRNMKQTTNSGQPVAESNDALLPSLRFYHSEGLRSKTLAVLEALETADDPTDQRKALASVVVELTETGLAYYFVKPVQAAKVGFMAEQSTKLGIASILRVMGPVTRRIIGGMDSAQLQVVASHIRHLMQ